MITTSPTPSAATLLDAAKSVARFLATQQVDTEHGVTWKRALDAEANGGHSLYHGSAGIALFLIELHRATADPSFLALALSAGDDIVEYLAGRVGLSVAPATGWPGFAMALTELADAADSDAGSIATERAQRFKASAAAALEQLRSQASELGSGIGWIEPMPFSDITGFSGDREIYDQSVGAAGAGCVLLWAHRRNVHSDALSWAIATADRLLDVAERDETGLRWRLMSNMPFPFTAPNFAHGGAGVGYFLADLYRETNDLRYLDAAIAAGTYVLARATPIGDGSRICHTEEADPALYYLGMCHGPVGTGRLLMLLAEITGDPSWSDAAHSLIKGLLATGAPEQRSDGLWNNVGQCCGDAGIGDYAILVHAATGDALYLDLAERCAANILARSVEPTEGTRAWNQAEHRVRPRFLQTQTGYMQGAAGIGSFLLHLATAGTGTITSGGEKRPGKIVFADMPSLTRRA